VASAEANREQQRRRYERGQCASCDRKRQPGRVHCERCSERQLRKHHQFRNSSLEARIYGLIIRAKSRAKKRGLPFDLELSDLLAPPAHFPVLGLKLSFANGRQQPNSPSLDRLIPERGYVRGN